MRFTQFDNLRSSRDSAGTMEGFWSGHWDSRAGLKEDLSDEPLWSTLEDVLRTPGILLEAGCGTGQWVQYLQRQGHVAVGIDYADTGLRTGKSANATLRLLRGDFRQLPFGDATFDYLCSFGAVEHDIAGPDAALREFNRVLKPAGWLMCSVPCLNMRDLARLPWMVARDWLKKQPLLRLLAGKKEPFEFYQYVYTPAAYRRILGECGFAVHDLRPYGLPPSKALVERLVGSLAPGGARFYAAHMMMAIAQRNVSGGQSGD